MYLLAMISAESLFMFAFDNACISSVFIIYILINNSTNVVIILLLTQFETKLYKSY